jgi:hypothetical protein
MMDSVIPPGVMNQGGHKTNTVLRNWHNCVTANREIKQ